MSENNNQSRYEAINDSLSTQPGVIRVGEVENNFFNHKKGKLFKGKRIFVAPSEGDLTNQDEISGFTDTLLTGIEGISRWDSENGRLRSFDVVESGAIYTPISVEVFPNLKVADAAIIRAQKFVEDKNAAI